MACVHKGGVGAVDMGVESLRFSKSKRKFRLCKIPSQQSATKHCRKTCHHFGIPKLSDFGAVLTVEACVDLSRVQLAAVLYQFLQAAASFGRFWPVMSRRAWNTQPWVCESRAGSSA